VVCLNWFPGIKKKKFGVGGVGGGGGVYTERS